MLKLLIEKDKTNDHIELADYIKERIFIEDIYEDEKYIILIASIKTKPGKKPTQREIKRFIRNVVDTVAEYIVLILPRRFVRETVLEKCCGDTQLKTEHICSLAIKGVEEEIRRDIKRYRRRNWYTEISKRILVNMLESKLFAVNAFIRFRLCDFKKYVLLNTEAILKTLPGEMRYMDFINSLQALVDKRSPKIYELKLSVDKDEFTLTDSNGVPVNISQFENMMNEKPEREDLLVSVLLLLAPVRLVITAEDEFYNSNLFSTISNIFGERVIPDYART